MWYMIVMILCSCNKDNSAARNYIKYQFQIIDSLTISNKGDSAVILLEKVRLLIKNDDPLICTYYRYQSERIKLKPAIMEVYADSALAFFSNDSNNVNKYQDEYIKVLLAKGHSSMFAKKYNTALNYYDKAKKLLANGNCDNGELDDKLAAIYYAQKNYHLAAQYWVENYKLLGNCDDKPSAQKLFYLQQSALNNTGYAYEQEGMLDSALYYFKEDLKCINKAGKANLINNYYTQTASIIVYDNLAGLNLKTGHLLQAEAYLDTCLNIPTKDIDGMRIPPFLKQAEVYIKTGRYPEAVAAFNKSRALLDLYATQNRGSEIKWNRLYGQYLIKTGHPEEAYRYQETYIRLNDSLDNSSVKLNRLDVNLELNTLHQQQALTELHQQAKLKQLYLVIIIVVAVLFVIIIVLINRNLKESRKNHLDTIKRNQELQTTLAELERANKNYIRIMRVMAHDLRNPLCGITGLTSLLLNEEEFSEDNRYMLRLIETTGTHALEMITELLTSGLSDENEPIAVEVVNLKMLLYDAVELLQFKAAEKGQQIVFESDNRAIMSRINREKIWRVFNNLIVNAVKFSYVGGIIKVNMKVDQDLVLISIADNGIGITEKDKEMVFEMFTAAKKQGTNGEQPFGLGLSISKKIIEMHAGKIWFENNPETGTIFYIRLNYVEDLELKADQPKRKEQKAESPT